MKNRDKALRLPTIRRLRIAVTASSNVRSGCLAISANNQPACFSNGETLPPLGFAAELPSSLQRGENFSKYLNYFGHLRCYENHRAYNHHIVHLDLRRSRACDLAINEDLTGFHRSLFPVSVLPWLAAFSFWIECVMSPLGRYCCKNRKSNNYKNLAKIDSLPTLSLQ